MLRRSVASAGLEQQLWVRAEQVSLIASVGIYRGEKDSRQEIMLNIAAEVGEPADDRIGETIDYRALVREAQKLSDEGHFELIETFICELRSEEHTSELQSLMRISYAVFCLKKKKTKQITKTQQTETC